MNMPYLLLSMASASIPALLLTAASAASAQPIVPSVDGLSADTVSIEVAHAPAPLDAKAEQNVETATRWDQNADDLATVGDGGSIVVRYGASIPTLVCAPLRICDIVLEPGEVVTAVDAGDTVRWALTPSVSGTGDTAQTHIVVKPFDAGLATNLLIATDRRTYRVKLASTSDRFMSSLSFSYPQPSTSAAWSKYQERTQAARVVSAPASAPALGALDFRYEVKGDRPTWRPTRVYTDGSQTVIELPPETASTDMPALVVLDDSSREQLVNYRIVGTKFVVDRVIERAMLVLGTGRKATKVKIERAL